ncbi:MAG: hypothetical protein IKR59_04740, partial [Lachnospiraceae bacterium]|nr:hypothetical protein [Lachnospiraceae bacterium]
AEFGGQIYLSAYAVPIPDRPGDGRDEFQGIRDHIYSKGESGFQISSLELTPLVRDNYTAVLLICDPDEGTAKTFFSVKGSVGDTLAANAEGELEWNVNRIDTAFFSPLTSSFSTGCVCRVFRYTFAADGSLTGQTDTGESAQFMR